MNEVNFLGFKIDRNGVWIDKDKLSQITGFKYPQSKNDLRRFLGMIGQYKK